MPIPAIALAARALFARAGGAAAAKFGGQAATKQVASGSVQKGAQSLLAPQQAAGGGLGGFGKSITNIFNRSSSSTKAPQQAAGGGLGGFGKSIANIFNRSSSSAKNVTGPQPAPPTPQNLGQLIKPQGQPAQPGGGIFQSIRNSFGGGTKNIFSGSNQSQTATQPPAPSPQHLGQLIQPQGQPTPVQSGKSGRSVANRSARVLARRVMRGKSNWFAPAVKGSAKSGAGVQQRAAMQASGKSMAPKAPRPLSPNIANVKNPGKLMSMMGQPNAVQAAIAQQNATQGPSKSGGGPAAFQSKSNIGKGGGGSGGSGNRPVGGGSGIGDTTSNALDALGPFGKGLKMAKGMFDKLPAPIKSVVSILVGGAGLAKALDAWATSLTESRRGLVQFNGQIANAYAKLDAQALRLNIEKAGATSGTTSALADEVGKFREETKDEMAAISTVINTIAIGFVKIGRGMMWFFDKVMDPLNFIPKTTKLLEKWFGKTVEENNAVKFAEEILKNTGPRPPLPPL